MMRRLLNAKMIAGLIVPVLLLALLLVPMGGGDSMRTVTAHFPQAISIYPGSDVAIMGVNVGKVKQVVPDGDSVKVVMEYDASYDLPADVKAAIVTPTLVADRFIQFAPAYTGGPKLADGGDIPEDRSVVPVEMDRIYASLNELTQALGPDGANKDGALGDALDASAKALQGNGQLGHDAIANLAGAAQVLGDSSDDLFATVESLAQVSKTLNANDATVQRFLTRLSKVSGQLAGEGDDLQAALDSIAKAVQVTEGFVRNNKKAVVGNIESLTETIKVLADQKQSLETTLQLAPLGLANLTDAFDTPTGTEGIRLQVGPTGMDLPGLLCGMVRNDKVPNAETVCQLFEALFPKQAVGEAGSTVTSHAGAPILPVPSGGKDIKTLVDEVAGLLGGGKK